MALKPVDQQRGNRKLEVGEIVDALLEQGYISTENAQITRHLAGDEEVAREGAIKLIAQKNWPNEQNPSGRIDERFLIDWLSEQVNLPAFHIDPLKTDVADVTSVMSYRYAETYRVLPVAVDGKTLTVATTEPYERSWIHEIERVANREIKLVLARPEDIKRYALEFYSLSKSVKGAEKRHSKGVSGVQNLEQLLDMTKAGDSDANDQHVVSVVDWLLQYAFDQRASDIHLEPRREVGLVRFRIDGVLHQVYDMPTGIMTAVTSRLKILGRLDVAEKRRPQDGRLKSRMPDGQEVELRLSTMPTAFGEKLVMRIFDPSVLVRNFSELGFPQQDQEKWEKMIRQPHGIILVTGPTGSGKTTTLYSTLRQLAQPEVNVCTVEDPIELIEPSFNQMQVQQKIGVNFASGIRTLLRQDPDIIMVGEIRDYETAEMAIQAALTGHLVLSTLHTNDAPSAISRLLELGVPSYMINATLLGVVAQRLVRTLCPSCKAPTEVNDYEWKGLTSPWKLASPEGAHKAVGCLECRSTGFRGRTGLYEVFLMDDNLREMNQPGTDLRVLRKEALKSGMVPLRIAGAREVAKGVTTVEEVLKVAPPSLDAAFNRGDQKSGD
ncbi:MAG: GspE/PulE family protein [Pseudomonadota bacterium]